MISRRRFIISSGALSFAPLIPNVAFGGKVSEYPYAYIHNDGCGGIAFRLDHRPEPFDVISSRGIATLTGEPVNKQSTIMCYSCMKAFTGYPQTKNIKYLLV